MNRTTEASNETSIAGEETADQWPARPRMFSAWGCGLALLGFCFALAMALAIVRSRQMPTEQTAPFWGPEVSKAIRVGRPVELLRPVGSQAAAELEFYNEGWIDLTELRDLGYFRRVFLADTNFDWTAARDMEIPPAEPHHWPWVFVRFGQNEPDAESVSIAIHLDEGWVGKPGGSRGIKLTESVRHRIAYRLRLFAKVENEAAQSPK